MNAYKQDEQRSGVGSGGGAGGGGGGGRHHDAPPRRELPPASKKSSPIGSVTTALHSSRRVRLLAASALIAVCGLAVPALALTRAPKPAQVLATMADLPAGTVVTSADLRAVDASGPGGAMVPVSDQSSIVGHTVRVEVPAGALLNEADFGSFPPTGTSIVPVAVRPGQYPSDLQTGQQVAVFPISGGTAAQVSTAAHAAAIGTVTGIAAVAADSSGEVVIDLDVATGSAAAVAQAPAVVLVGLDAQGDAP